ncbi:hypothetical protein ACJ41O_011027 [Fusarium nematophilum]
MLVPCTKAVKEQVICGSGDVVCGDTQGTGLSPEVPAGIEDEAYETDETKVREGTSLFTFKFCFEVGEDARPETGRIPAEEFQEFQLILVDIPTRALRADFPEAYIAALEDDGDPFGNLLSDGI